LDSGDGFVDGDGSLRASEVIAERGDVSENHERNVFFDWLVIFIERTRRRGAARSS
jgi:hypothetical protein